MDMLKTVREIGFFEACNNLSAVLESEEIKKTVGSAMPLPTTDFDKYTEQIAEWLESFGKEKYLFFTPEIALIDRIADQEAGKEVMLIVPCDMEEEVKKRLTENLPQNMKVSLLLEPYFPENFYPENGMLIICGYLAGGRTMVLPETYRMIEHYGGFWGKKVFIPFTRVNDAVRYDGWMEIGKDKFTTSWRDEV